MEPPSMKLSKYSVGTGDRFAHQAKAQLRACIRALESGVEVIPVWNKSNREHTIIGSEPLQCGSAADAAVKALGWKHPYFCDADHITSQTVGRFLECVRLLHHRCCRLHWPPARRTTSMHSSSGILTCWNASNSTAQASPSRSRTEILRQTAPEIFDRRAKKAGEVYRIIEEPKEKATSSRKSRWMRPTRAQSPVELLIILAAIADEGIPVQTIAPKFSGRFNKGVDYVGDVAQFEREFALDVAAIAYAVRAIRSAGESQAQRALRQRQVLHLPAIHATMKQFDAGVHLKTAGTTWLEELIGLAEAGGEGLELAKEIYAEAFAHRDELCAPYAAVIDIDTCKVALPGEVEGWSSEQYTSALRHVPGAAGLQQQPAPIAARGL